MSIPVASDEADISFMTGLMFPLVGTFRQTIEELLRRTPIMNWLAAHLFY